MPIRHTVRKGDTLWGLAHRYLGSGTRWPLIFSLHNQEAAKPGQPPLLLPIKNPDLIYVAQTILIPERQKNAPPGTGIQFAADTPAMPVNVKVTYTIGRDTPPIIYIGVTAGYTIKTEMCGAISIELMSSDRYHHSLELFMSKEPTQAKMKLKDVYDPALCALTVDPEMVLDSGTGKIIIKTPIGTKANLGSYKIEVKADSPIHLSGKLKPTTINGTVKVNDREFKYCADLEFKVDVDLHPGPRGRVVEPVKVTDLQPKEEIAERFKDSTIDWSEFAVKVAWTLIGTAMMAMGCRPMATTTGNTSVTPLIYTINPKDIRNIKFYEKNA